MKNLFKTILIIAMIATIASGCKRSFNDLYNNDNKPLAVPASLLFTGILNDMYEAPYSSKEKWSQFFITNYAYYGNNRYDFGPGDDYYGTLKNVAKMQEEAKNVGLPNGNVYDALAKFFKAYLFSKMSLEMGDLPMTGALQGSNNLTPSYDSQKKIFQQCFSWLDSANTQLAALVAAQDNNLKGDIYYGNDLTKWQKLVNTYSLRLLIELSKQIGDADLNLGSQFQTILNNKSSYPVMESMSDNLQYVFTHPTNDYPNNPGNV
ncbi:MAG TPA: SusD/RagB family nutrient-binding outer membrane lipoprotein, partial [Chitinophagaceae bacterium]